MLTEINLEFPTRDRVIVTLDREPSSRALAFVDPFTAEDHAELRWYVETYGAHSLGDPDDAEARRIAARLPDLGRALFKAVFSDHAAFERFSRFRRIETGTRLLTISAEHPAILALPWELLHDPHEPGVFLFQENPRISVRRRVRGADDGRAPFTAEPKDTLRLLFVVSRPDDAGFLDPRADTQPVLDAIDANAPGRVVCEFLRPPTLTALMERLGDDTRPPIDILYFDGHGVFDSLGGLPRRFDDARAHNRGDLDALLREKNAAPPTDPDAPPSTGYLLFENDEHKAHLVSARLLGADLHRQRISLVILSACESAAIGGATPDDPADHASAMGSVAARLTATGIPSVLAMTHSVMFHTTRLLFGELFKQLARRRSIGVALDESRRHLINRPERYDVQRGPVRVPLRLQDWFIPALYQPGDDGPLLSDAVLAPPRPARPDQFPRAPEAGFFGRKRDLWHIERWFAGKTRRISLTGFGGQGKTALAQEAGRWLTRTGMFELPILVDCAQMHGRDAVAIAVRNISSALDQTLLDADSVTAALRTTPTLVILDNLEALDKSDLHALLDAAIPWSEAGASRVLCTSRQPDFDHPGYRVHGTLIHRRIQLTGLGSRRNSDDALEWFAALNRLPPAPTIRPPLRDGVIAVFDLVKFHPLSIRVLAQQLKTRGTAELGERLEHLLATTPTSLDPDNPSVLIASIQLSLDRLDEQCRKFLPHLGVFQGGAMEDSLLDVTGLGESGSRAYFEQFLVLAQTEPRDIAVLWRFWYSTTADPSQADLDKFAAKLPDFILETQTGLEQLKAPLDIWPTLRRQLEEAALIEVEQVPGYRAPFIRFHPTLAPLLRTQLSPNELAHRRTAHQRYYCMLIPMFHELDSQSPQQIRAVVRHELPNFSHAVAALDVEDPHASTFSVLLLRFVESYFRLTREAEHLRLRAGTTQGIVGSNSWFQVQYSLGENLLASGKPVEASQVFDEMLRSLEDESGYQKALIFTCQAACLSAHGRFDLAVTKLRSAISIAVTLPSEEGRGLHLAAVVDLANNLSKQRMNPESRAEYEAALPLAKALRNPRSEGVILANLGTIALNEGDLQQAISRYSAALLLFRALQEPISESTAHQQLGIAYQALKQWDVAEEHLRHAARIREEHGPRVGPDSAALTWAQLGLLFAQSGKPSAAESWLKMAIDAFKKSEAWNDAARNLLSLALLLADQPERLQDSRRFAAEALDLWVTHDLPQIWKTYRLLAEISRRGAAASPEPARTALLSERHNHRRVMIETLLASDDARQQYKSHARLIAECAWKLHTNSPAPSIEAVMPQMEEGGWTALAAAIRQILAGERDEMKLYDMLDDEEEEVWIVGTILAGIKDPSTLEALRQFLPTDFPAHE